MNEPPNAHVVPQVSGDGGAARISGRIFRITDIVAVASDEPVVAADKGVSGLQLPDCDVQPVEVTSTASASPATLEKDKVKLGRTVEPKLATASLVLAGILGQLHVRVAPEILQPG